MSLTKYSDQADSGIEWLGDVPMHWHVVRLRHVAELNPSKSEVGELDRELPVSFLPMEAVGDDGTLRLEQTRPIGAVENGYTYFREGDVTLAKITPCFENGKGAIMRGLLNGIGFGTTELIVVRPRSEHTTSDYLHWLFMSSHFRRIGESTMYGAGGQKRVPDDFVRNFSVAIPPLNEQVAISSFLDVETSKIDGLVAEQRRLIALLKEKRQAVISHAVTKGLNPHAPLKPSGIQWLGDVPKGWNVVSVRHVIGEIEQGWSPQCDSRPADPLEWGILKTGCVNRGVFSEVENKALQEGMDPIVEYEVRQGDVLMSRASGSSDLVGATAFVCDVRPHLMLSDKTFRIQFADTMEPEFFVAVFNSKMMRAQIERSISGAEGLAKNLPQSKLKCFALVLPPIAEQAEIVRALANRCEQFDQLQAKAQRAIELLQERRTALISAAVTGKIDVRGFA